MHMLYEKKTRYLDEMRLAAAAASLGVHNKRPLWLASREKCDVLTWTAAAAAERNVYITRRISYYERAVYKIHAITETLFYITPVRLQFDAVFISLTTSLFVRLLMVVLLVFGALITNKTASRYYRHHDDDDETVLLIEKNPGTNPAVNGPRIISRSLVFRYFYFFLFLALVKWLPALSRSNGDKSFGKNDKSKEIIHAKRFVFVSGWRQQRKLCCSLQLRLVGTWQWQNDRCSAQVLFG